MLTYAMVTTAPGPDVQTIGHHRQPVILQRQDLADWLDPAIPVNRFLEPSPSGTFSVELAERPSRLQPATP